MSDRTNSLIETNETFRDIVISLAATYGLYFISSFIHFEPWHMFTSFMQYMFFLPSCTFQYFLSPFQIGDADAPCADVNILMTYAMCNLHDVTWGTKGDNGSAKDLGGAKKAKDANGNEVLEVEVPTSREDVEDLWQASRVALRNKPPEEKEHRDAATKQADHDRNSRTNVVVLWMITNMFMILFFTSEAFNNWVKNHVRQGSGDAVFNPYLSFLFYALYVLPIFYVLPTPLLIPRLQCSAVSHSILGQLIIPPPASCRLVECFDEVQANGQWTFSDLYFLYDHHYILVSPAPPCSPLGYLYFLYFLCKRPRNFMCFDLHPNRL